MKTVTRKEVRDPVVMFDGENVYATKRTVTTVSDIRDTVIGPVDFGYVEIGEARIAIGDTFTLDVEVKAPWWAFWRKPKTERRQFMVTGAFPSP